MTESSAAQSGVSAWEEAYRRFETPEQEVRKFRRRLLRLGAFDWPRDAAVVELFCGRGNGLHALESLSFRSLEGVDLSPTLLKEYQGPARTYVGDCRSLPFADRSKDVLVVQGGLHHLLQLPHDLLKTLSEAKRVLRPRGRFVAVEPWSTPFLTLVHALCGLTLVRRLSRKLDALATMIELERPTYENWLSNPAMVSSSLRDMFEAERFGVAWGKLSFVGRA
jgi:ubiquinone/menaquinone biosynthesis C-methylase UbiE